jgi:SAM-dependent methyltransferase
VKVQPTPGIFSPIRILSSSEFRKKEKRSICRIVDVHDWYPDSKISFYASLLAEGVYIHRKSWEYALATEIISEALSNLGDCVILATGAGYERPLYYFANHAKMMVATDLYDNPDHEGKPAMLTNPEMFAPFPYVKEKLQVMTMDATSLSFSDSTFDATFCLSSIEHFGSREKISKAFSEMIRVTKTGGIVVIATEVIISGPEHQEYFLPHMIQDIFLRDNRLELLEDIDWDISDASLSSLVDIREPAHVYQKSPHVVLTDGIRVWTSIMLAFRRVSL